eukprot:303641-Prymnesium_polylepis.1
MDMGSPIWPRARSYVRGLPNMAADYLIWMWAHSSGCGLPNMAADYLIWLRARSSGLGLTAAGCVRRPSAGRRQLRRAAARRVQTEGRAARDAPGI